MSEVVWEDEKKDLLDRLSRCEQIAAESQAEAAVYRELLEDWCEVAEQAREQQNFSLLKKINRRIPPFYLPREEEGKLWGKLFLHACMRDARWLTRAKQALERIKADAKNLSDLDENDDESSIKQKSESNMMLKKSIIDAADYGLIEAI